MFREFIEIELDRLSELPPGAVPSYVGSLCGLSRVGGNKLLLENKRLVKAALANAFESEDNPKVVFYMLESMFRVSLPFYPEISVFNSLGSRFSDVEDIERYLSTILINLKDYQKSVSSD